MLQIIRHGSQQHSVSLNPVTTNNQARSSQAPFEFLQAHFKILTF